MTKAILLDIEGTTTPIEYVHDVLFPFAKRKMPGYVAAHFDALSDEIEQLRLEHQKDLGYTDDFDPSSANSVAKYLAFLIDADRKSTPLKSIQGEIWKLGYDSRELVSKVFDDVPRAFERWRSEGKVVAIYSSGSVLAQQLLFRNTDHGDLTTYISNYFDTTTGAKREAESYKKIVSELGFPPQEIVFCSDIPEELDAAKAAGLLTALVVRPGNAPVEDAEGYRVVIDFDQL